VLGSQDGINFLSEDTHVAVVEKAPHMNEEELMLVFAEVVRWEHLCEMGLSVSVNKSCSWIHDHNCGCCGGQWVSARATTFSSLK
jgi:hypothetical protein